MTRRFGAVIIVVLVTAFTVTYLLLRQANEPHHRSEVVTLHFEPVPEGIGIADQHNGDPAWVALPDELPHPLDQPAGCNSGAVVTLTLANGETLGYGPCTRPATLDKAISLSLYPG